MHGGLPMKLLLLLLLLLPLLAHGSQMSVVMSPAPACLPVHSQCVCLGFLRPDGGPSVANADKLESFDGWRFHLQGFRGQAGLTRSG
eukprot:693839-Hanusia_phi.AAC.4